MKKCSNNVKLELLRRMLVSLLLKVFSTVKITKPAQSEQLSTKRTTAFNNVQLRPLV